MKKTIIIISLISVVIVGYLLANRMLNKVKQEGKKNDVTQIAVSTIEPTTGNIEGSVSYIGTVAGINEAMILAQTGGVLKQVNFNVGQRVGDGTVLAVVENSQQSAGLEQAKAQVLAAENNYDKANLDLSRFEKLQNESAVSKSQLELAQLNVKAAFAQLKGAQAGLKVSEKQLADTYIKSTISGTVSTKDADKGSTIGPGSRIALIVDNSKFKIKIMVSESDIPLLSVKKPVKIIVDALINREFTGYVNTIGISAENGMRSYPVEVIIDGKSCIDLKSGMFARCEIQSRISNNAVIIPELAIINNNDGTKSVYVVENGKAILRQVKLGVKANESYEVLSGIKAQEKVVTEGKERLSDGILVQEMSK
jgi:RND family efflux transporter MFP subunit